MKKVKALLEGAVYKFAKTMVKSPHHYTLRATWNEQDFESVVKYIYTKGVVGRYYNSQFMYLYIGRFKYWCYANPYDIEAKTVSYKDGGVFIIESLDEYAKKCSLINRGEV